MYSAVKIFLRVLVKVKPDSCAVRRVFQRRQSAEPVVSYRRNMKNCLRVAFAGLPVHRELVIDFLAVVPANLHAVRVKSRERAHRVVPVSLDKNERVSLEQKMKHYLLLECVRSVVIVRAAFQNLRKRNVLHLLAPVPSLFVHVEGKTGHRVGDDVDAGVYCGVRQKLGCCHSWRIVEKTARCVF